MLPTVWIAEWTDHESFGIIGVFSSQQLALDSVKTDKEASRKNSAGRPIGPDGGCKQYSVVSYVIDGDPETSGH